MKRVSKIFIIITNKEYLHDSRAWCKLNDLVDSINQEALLELSRHSIMRGSGAIRLVDNVHLLTSIVFINFVYPSWKIIQTELGKCKVPIIKRFIIEIFVRKTIAGSTEINEPNIITFVNKFSPE